MTSARPSEAPLSYLGCRSSATPEAEMRVLLVEDDFSTAASVELMLRAEGYLFDTTGLGEDGLQIGLHNDYDIVILDLMLPDIAGQEVIRRLRSSGITTPILILSGLSEHDQKSPGIADGADGYMTKPFHRGELVECIEALVSRVRAERDGAATTR